MIINPIIMGSITDSAQEAFSVGSKRAIAFEGSYHKEVLEIGSITVIVDVRGDIAYVIILDNEALFAFKNSKHTNFSTLSYDDSSWDSDLNILTVSYYGNVDWKGLENTVLCWQGVASRHFEIDPTVYVKGYMEFEEEVIEYINGLPFPRNYYTPFGPNIFANGFVLDTIPNQDCPIYKDGELIENRTTAPYTFPKVLGCAYDSVGSLVAIVGNNYRGVQNPEGSLGGFFNEVYKQVGGVWCRIWHRAGSRPTANWFFNQTGIEACSVFNKTFYQITIDGLVVTYKEAPACSGTTQETKTTVKSDPYGVGLTAPVVQNGYQFGNPSDYTTVDGSKVGDGTVTTTITVVETQRCIVAADYNSTGLIKKEAVYTLDEKSIYLSDKYVTMGWQDFYFWDAQPVVEYAIIGPDVFTTLSDYTITGGCNPKFGPAPTGCGMGTITATDLEGKVATKQVRMPSGQWQLVSKKTGLGNNPPPSAQITEISGGTKIVWEVTGYCGSCPPSLCYTVNSDKYLLSEYSEECGSCITNEPWAPPCDNLPGRLGVYWNYKNTYQWVCP